MLYYTSMQLHTCLQKRHTDKLTETPRRRPCMYERQLLTSEQLFKLHGGHSGGDDAAGPLPPQAQPGA